MADQPFLMIAAAAGLLLFCGAAPSARAQDVATLEPDGTTLTMLSDQGSEAAAARSAQQDAVEARLDGTRGLLLEGLNAHGSSLTLEFEGPSGGTTTAVAAKDHIAKQDDLETGRFGLWSSGALVVDTAPWENDRSGSTAVYTDGLTFGADALVDPDILLGTAMGLAFDDRTIDSRSASFNSNYASTMLYGTVLSGNQTYLDFSAGAARVAFKTARCVDGALWATGLRPGTQFFAMSKYSVRRRAGRLVLKPFGKAEVARTTLDAFTETGPEALAYDAQIVTRLGLSLGLSGETSLHTAAGWFRPHAQVDLARDIVRWSDGAVGDPGSLVLADYLVEGTNTDTRQLNFGMGVDWAAARAATFGLNYRLAAPLSGAETAQTWKATASLKF